MLYDTIELQEFVTFNVLVMIAHNENNSFEKWANLPNGFAISSSDLYPLVKAVVKMLSLQVYPPLHGE